MAASIFDYQIPDNFTLDSDKSVRIWTKSGTNNNTNLYMAKTTPVWRNSGDCGYLRDDTTDLSIAGATDRSND